ncbi:tRNA preQ1(34) S-adenosylmethionine ribosyltransferase-isomerase QueA [Natronogracilivirga saccharolytica]|uniref:S-adenosylmethionine:tRNA ribosyltransferase-isomerase n=1 Tax=Natronogracilivirga saccharolytica TaxID=2812953 RepID=A0A8J7S884_9BACT|nr:tRNA preQ1(34) S-adenosylmethionine ribosyltransferase-isomerase QueA [Natronogracilivirga saccharolytica]MBP3192026.1 tRNA preQ1(34) S-adenosylmethionine ribosyltransferase-isomerase QueA [Natronogracilivirga saccharolytica]
MKLTDFRYEFDSIDVPAHPVEPRDAARLMVLNRADKTITHETFADIHKYFNKGDCLIYNNTKVFPARLKGKKEKTEASIEVFLLRELQPENKLWDVLVEPARKIRIGNKLYFGDDLVAEVVDNTTSRGRTIRFLFDEPNEKLYSMLDQLGEMPLPPYIDRKPEEKDKERYQTIFARERGAVAAPTAGMHFTPELIDKLKEKGVRMAPVTLHIGWGTFRQVEVEDLTKHRMDSENYYISEETSRTINEVLDSKKNKVVACGISSVRVVETSTMASGHAKPAMGWTDKFIYPPYDFKITEGLITNFHRPESTMLMLAAAFADFDFLMQAYKEAAEKNYRFYSFGDAMLII